MVQERKLLFDQLKTLGLLYVRPFRAIGRILDHGTLGWSALLALASVALVSLPWILELRSMMQQALANVATPEVDAGATLALRTVSGEMVRLPLTALFLMAAVFVPVSVTLAARLEGSGSAGIALQRDYMPALVCHLMSWSVALLPVAALHWIFPFRMIVPEVTAAMTWRVPGAPAFLGAYSLVLFGVAALYFLFLSVCVMRTVAGTGFGRAAGASVGGLLASAIMVWVYYMAGNVAYYLASPWVLYYLYITFGSDIRAVGGGLSSRQRLRHLLETATVNPRDADARYQLGLIYQQRRDLAQARASFEKALQIDPQEPDALYQLGCVLRAQGDPAAALEHLQAAAAIDDKLASSDVWREIGAAALDLDKNQHARDVLRVYTTRRPFDAEGLYWYGVALSRLGETQEARTALQAAMEAVRTAPTHRRRQIRRWESLASKQLRQLS
jgi:hypothetical protein